MDASEDESHYCEPVSKRHRSQKDELHQRACDSIQHAFSENVLPKTPPTAQSAPTFKLWSFPTEIIGDITFRIALRDLAHLWQCGDGNLNAKLTSPGSVRSIYCPAATRTCRLMVEFAAKFPSLLSLRMPHSETVSERSTLHFMTTVDSVLTTHLRLLEIPSVSLRTSKLFACVLPNLVGISVFDMSSSSVIACFPNLQHLRLNQMHCAWLRGEILPVGLQTLRVRLLSGEAKDFCITDYLPPALTHLRIDVLYDVVCHYKPSATEQRAPAKLTFPSSLTRIHLRCRDDNKVTPPSVTMATFCLRCDERIQNSCHFLQAIGGVDFYDAPSSSLQMFTNLTHLSVPWSGIIFMTFPKTLLKLRVPIPNHMLRGGNTDDCWNWLTLLPNSMQEIHLRHVSEPLPNLSSEWLSSNLEKSSALRQITIGPQDEWIRTVGGRVWQCASAAVLEAVNPFELDHFPLLRKRRRVFCGEEVVSYYKKNVGIDDMLLSIISHRRFDIFAWFCPVFGIPTFNTLLYSLGDDYLKTAEMLATPYCPSSSYRRSIWKCLIHFTIRTRRSIANCIDKLESAMREFPLEMNEAMCYVARRLFILTDVNYEDEDEAMPIRFDFFSLLVQKKFDFHANSSRILNV